MCTNNKIRFNAYTCKNGVTIQCTPHTQCGQTVVKIGDDITVMMGMHVQVSTNYDLHSYLVQSISNSHYKNNLRNLYSYKK